MLFDITKAIWRSLSRALRALVLSACAMGTTSLAQAPSDKPVRLLVPWPAGGSSDNVARLLAAAMAADLGITIFVENRSGAGGKIGTRLAATGQLDGLTMLAVNNSTLVAGPATDPSVGYDPLTSFDFVAVTALVPSILVASTSAPFSDFQGLIAFAKSHPGGVSYASYGVGSAPHISGELLAKLSGTDLLHVPYQGGAAAKLDVIAGRVDLLFTDLTVLADVRAGKLKALATTFPSRLADLPDLPTTLECGLLGLEGVGWHGLAFRAGTSQQVILRFNASLNRVLQHKDVIDQLAAYGMIPGGGTSAQLRERVVADLHHYQAALQGAGAKPSSTSTPEFVSCRPRSR